MSKRTLPSFSKASQIDRVTRIFSSCYRIWIILCLSKHTKDCSLRGQDLSMVKAMKEIFKYIGLFIVSILTVSLVSLFFKSTPPTDLLYIGSAFLFMVFAVISLKRKKVNILELCSFHRITIKDIIFSILISNIFFICI